MSSETASLPHAPRSGRRLSPVKSSLRIRGTEPEGKTRRAPGFIPRSDLILGVLLVALTLVASLFYRPVFASWSFFAPPIIGAALSAAVVATMCDRLRLTSGIGQLIQFAAFCLVVPALVSLSGSAHGFPSTNGFRSLMDAVVEGPARLLTSPIPVPPERELVIVPVLGAWWGISLAWLALRHRHTILATLAPTLALVAALAFGPVQKTTLRASTIVFCLGLFGYLVTAELRTKQRVSITRSRSARVRELLPALATVIAVSVLATVANPLLPFGAARDRFSLRTYRTPPFDVQVLSSPLANYRKFLTPVYQDRTLFTAEGDLPESWRLATLSAYDGRVWAVGSGSRAAGEFDLLGKQLDPARADDGDATNKRTTISISGLDEPFLPMPGKGVSIDLEASTRSLVRHNSTNDVLVWANGQSSQVSYALTWRPQQPARLATITTERFDRSEGVQPLDELPEALRRYATDASVGAATDGDIVRAINTRLTNGYYTLGARAGHSYGSLTRLIADPQRMVGNEEHYTAALALFIRSLGIPSRVVVGFRPSSAGQTIFAGRDISAWVEVKFEKAGWVAVRPTPEHTRVPKEIASQQDTGNERPRTQTEPLPKPEPDEAAEAASNPTETEDHSEQRRIPTAMKVGALLAGLPTALIGLFVAVVAGGKVARRRRRRRQADPAKRIAGAWEEALERLYDHDVRISQDATFLEAVVAARQTRAQRGLDGLGAACERAAFAATAPTDTQAAVAWGHLQALVERLESNISRSHQLRAIARPGSLRSRRTT